MAAFKQLALLLFAAMTVGLTAGIYAEDCTNDGANCVTWGPGDVTMTCCEAMGFVPALGDANPPPPDDRDVIAHPEFAECGGGTWETMGMCEPVNCGYCCGGDAGVRTCTQN